MTHNTQIVLPFARLSGKILQADFAGGTLTSDGGVLFLREIEAQIGVMSRFVRARDDPRDPRYTDLSDAELLRQRICQISCGYDDANDCNSLRGDPAFKAAWDRLPIVGEDLASPPTMSRVENAPRRTELYRMGKALVETFLASYERPPTSIVLDIDDTEDAVHGAQPQALFNGYDDADCSLPLHMYAGQSGTLIPSIRRPGRRPTGAEIVSMLKRVVGAMRHEWPEVSILLRGDGHVSTPEVHQWCESQEPVLFYMLGQRGNAVLPRKALGIVEQARSRYRYKHERSWRKQAQRNRQPERAKGTQGRRQSSHQEPKPPQELLKAKLYTSFMYKAGSWLEAHRIICKVEVSDEGENIRFVVTNLETNRTQLIYETIYCGRGQMENDIKDHKLFLHADRTSCHKFEANQFRLFLHSAAYVVMHTFRTTGLRGTSWCKAPLNQSQLRLLKVGARIHE